MRSFTLIWLWTCINHWACIIKVKLKTRSLFSSFSVWGFSTSCPLCSGITSCYIITTSRRQHSKQQKSSRLQQVCNPCHSEPDPKGLHNVDWRLVNPQSLTQYQLLALLYSKECELVRDILGGKVVDNFFQVICTQLLGYLLIILVAVGSFIRHLTNKVFLHSRNEFLGI